MSLNIPALKNTVGQACQVRSRIARPRTGSGARRSSTIVQFSQDFKQYLLINLDDVTPPFTGKYCDFVFFGNDVILKSDWIVVIEFKGRVKGAGSIIEQLQGGATFAEHMCNQASCKPASKFMFKPVLMCRTLRKYERNQLKTKIRCFGKNTEITVETDHMEIP